MLPRPPRITTANALAAARSPMRRIRDEHRPEQRAGGRGEARAEREGGGVDVADLHAHQRRRLAVLERRAHRPPSWVRLMSSIRCGDQRSGQRRARRPGIHATDTGPITSGAAGNGCRSTCATPVQASCSAFCSAIQAPIITSMVVSMSAPRSRRSSTSSSSAPSATPSAMASGERDEEVGAGQHHQHVHHVRAERVQLAVREVDHAA